MRFSKGGECFLVDGQGHAQRRTSGVLGSREILDLIQIDDEVQADALVRDPTSGDIDGDGHTELVFQVHVLAVL